MTIEALMRAVLNGQYDPSCDAFDIVGAGFPEELIGSWGVVFYQFL